MNTKLISQTVIVAALGSITSGCLEHTYHISVLPDERVELRYKVAGDRLDFDDELQLLPDSTDWGLERSVEEHENETVHIIEGSLLIARYTQLDRALDWQLTEEDTVYLRRSVSPEKSSQLFGVAWRFHGKLHSRCFDELYGDIWDFVPSECRALDDEEQMDTMTAHEIEMLEVKFALGILQWNRSRYEHRIDRVWELVKARVPGLPDTTAITYSIVRAGWVNDLHRYLNKLDMPEPTTANLDWWSDLRPLFLGRLVDITGPGAVEVISRISDAAEREYQITKDIEDDVFCFKLHLPGRTVRTNGSSEDEGWILWEFTGKELLSQDGVMSATSFELSWWRAVLAAFAAVLILSWIRRRIRRARGQEKI